MPGIKVIEEHEATGELRASYEQIRREAGAVANILKIHSLAPHTLTAHAQIYAAAMHAPGELSRARREMIAVHVSQLNHCHY